MFDVHQTPAAAYRVTVDGDTFRYRDSNQAARDLCGLAKSQFIDLTPQDCFPPAVAAEVIARYRACRDSKSALSYVFEANLKSGIRQWRTTLFPEVDPNGVVVALVGICLDTRHDLAKGEAGDSFHQRVSIAFDAMDGGFWVYEIGTGTFEMSRSLAELIAGPGHATLSLAEYIGFVHEEDLPNQSILSENLDGTVYDFRIISYDQRLRWLRSRRRFVRDANGQTVRIVSFVSDVTNEKVTVQTLEAKASTDSLTALANRRAFDSFGALAKARAVSTGQRLDLVLFDLDCFKPVNDRYGHRAGDLVLRKVARRVAKIVPKGNMLARIGGDEFAIILQNADDATVDRVIAKLQRAFKKPFDLDGLPVSIGVSIGHAASLPSDQSFEVLVERADRALYTQKRERHRLIA